MKRVVLIALAILAMAPAPAWERKVQYRVTEFSSVAGGVPIGEQCTTAQQDACELACREQMQPNELLKKTRCEQTAWWGTPGGSGFDCHCWVLTVDPAPTTDPRPEPPSPGEA